MVWLAGQRARSKGSFHTATRPANPRPGAAGRVDVHRDLGRISYCGQLVLPRSGTEHPLPDDVLGYDDDGVDRYRIVLITRKKTHGPVYPFADPVDLSVLIAAKWRIEMHAPSRF